MNKSQALTQQLLDHLQIIPHAHAQQQLLLSLAVMDRPRIVSFVNAHAYNLLHTDAQFAMHLLQSDIILRDGIGMEIFLKLMRKTPGLNMNGTDFIPLVLAQNKKLPLALFGTADANLQNAKNKLLAQQHSIVAAINGFQAEEIYLAAAETARPSIILLAMGMPKQERIAAFLKQHLTHPCLIINGGAILDFISNQIPRAPAWVRQLRCEWLFRLYKEPRRLWRRYLLGNFLFLARVAKLSWRLR